MIRSPRRRKLHIFSSKLALALVAVAVGFLSYQVYLAAYEKYQINKQISNLDGEIQALAKRSQDLKGLVVRFQNKDVIEKEARKKLNLVKEGEKAVIVTDVAHAQDAAPVSETAAPPGWLANPQKWWSAIFSH